MGVHGPMHSDGKALQRLMDPQGYSLIEVLIASVVLAIGLLGVAGMQVTAIKGNSYGHGVTQATFFAQDMIEQLKNSTDISAEVNGNDTSGVYNRAWQLQAATGNARLVTVTVTWTDAMNNHRVVLNTVTRGNGE